MTIDVEIKCDDCGNEASVALCQRHIQAQYDEEYEKGRKNGYQEGYDVARAEFDKTE